MTLYVDWPYCKKYRNKFLLIFQRVQNLGLDEDPDLDPDPVLKMKIADPDQNQHQNNADP
jgi:hypothetical protein